MSCIFCKIVSKEIPSQIVYEDETVLAFNDISPIAPEHILVIPKKHIASVNEISLSDKDITTAMFNAINKIAKMKNLNDDGYRLIINNGRAAGQEVFHLHIHILGGSNNLGPMLVK